MGYFEVLIGLITITFFLIVYFKWSFSYWKRKKVAFKKPSFPFGNIDNPIGKLPNLSYILQKQYNYFKSIGEDHGGVYFFNYPIWVPFGSEHLRNILVRNFDSFTDKGMYSNAKHDPLSANVFLIDGKRWKEIRGKLTPAFTPGKMKMMFNLLVECSKQMSEVVHDSFNKTKEVNIKELLACFTTDVISSCAFGLESNTCKNPDAEFRKFGKMILDFSAYEVVRNTIATVIPDVCRALGVLLIKPCVAEFFLSTITNTFGYREKNNIYRKDFLQILIDMKNHNANNNNENKKEVGMTLEQMAAEAFAFYLGSFETSAGTQTFALLELSQNQEIQDRAREEVLEVLAQHNGEFTYESLQEMTYIQQIVDETLRKYPLVPVLMRRACEDYKVKDSDIIINKGTKVFVPVYAIHRDPENFPNPELFDPDRFSPKNKGSIKSFTYLPFGHGPRNCIGLRFGIMQTKLGIATLLKDHKFTLNEKTVTPVEFNNHNFVLEAQGGVYLNLEKVEHS